MGEGETTFNPEDSGFKDIEQSEQYAEREKRKRAVLARLILDRRTKLLRESQEPGDASSEPGGEVTDLWASMPHAGKDFQASLAEDERVTEEVTGGDESDDPLDFFDMPVF